MERCGRLPLGLLKTWWRGAPRPADSLAAADANASLTSAGGLAVAARTPEGGVAKLSPSLGDGLFFLCDLTSSDGGRVQIGRRLGYFGSRY